MFARIALLAIAILAAGSASASRQTHELIQCGADPVVYLCYGVDGDTPIIRVRRINELYESGWRLIDVVVKGNTVTYWLERPIAPEQ